MVSCFNTPLRYPGGKGGLTGYFEQLLAANGLEGGTYIEPFAGGAGVAINLLVHRKVKDIVINDADEHVYSFWKAATEHSDELIEMVRTAELSVSEWERQHSIFQSQDGSTVERGFATFYLNRTNRSGILDGGIIGGKNQNGPYKLDARFNRTDLTRRLAFIGAQADHIRTECTDGVYFLQNYLSDYPPESTLVYIDPPYYDKGSLLYMNCYSDSDHQKLAGTVKSMTHPWVLSYDDVPEIRKLYSWAVPTPFQMYYSAYRTRLGRELFYTSPGLRLPDGTSPSASLVPSKQRQISTY